MTKAYIAWSNERNEHGGFVPERTQPFRSSSSDLHQSIFRCNGDLHFKDRVVPEQAMDDNGGAVEPTASGGSQSTLFFGSRTLSTQCRVVFVELRGRFESLEHRGLLYDKVPIQNATGTLCSIGTDHYRNEAFRGGGSQQGNRKPIASCIGKGKVKAIGLQRQ